MKRLKTLVSEKHRCENQGRFKPIAQIDHLGAYQDLDISETNSFKYLRKLERC